MKRILTLLLLITISMVGCNVNSAAKATSTKLPKDVTIQLTELTPLETQMATATCESAVKYTFAKGHTYNINHAIYEYGEQTSEGSMSDITTKGIDGKERDIPVIISNQSAIGRKTNSQNEYWSISANMGKTSFPIELFKNGENASFRRSIAQKQYKMEKGKEYVLYYVAFTKGSTLPQENYNIFKDWANAKDKTEQLKKFRCVFVVTAQLADSSK